MRVAFDTNVLISAYLTRGLSADLFRFVMTEHDVILSEVVLEEFGCVLTSEFDVPESVVTEVVKELGRNEVVASSAEATLLEFIRDPDDRFVVATAFIGRADVLVTGDRDLLDVREQITGVQILSPRECWLALRQPR